MNRCTRTIFGVAALLIVGLGCSDDSTPAPSDDPGPAPGAGMGPVFETEHETIAVRPTPNAERSAYFGDLHVHTTYSFDAFAFGTTATPYDAYRYAKGEPLLHPGGFEMKLREPLDFYAVTDHAMFLGVMRAAADTSTELSKLELSEPLHDLNAPDKWGS